MLALHFCGFQSLQSAVCDWERQAPLTGREPWPLGLAQRLKNDAVPTELLWKLQVSALLQLDLRRHICYDLANLCHPTGGLFTCVCSDGLPGCKTGCPIPSLEASDSP